MLSIVEFLYILLCNLFTNQKNKKSTESFIYFNELYRNNNRTHNNNIKFFSKNSKVFAEIFAVKIKNLEKNKVIMDKSKISGS